MFTGIVQSMAEVRAVTARGGDVELLIGCGALDLQTVATGDSIAVNGCCLTVTRFSDTSCAADVSKETLALTTLAIWQVGSRVNLAAALRAGQPLGGHYVTGHIDGVAEVIDLQEDARSRRVTFAVPPSLARYIARKGSVCIDGVSLTVNEVGASSFGVNLIPHTLSVTILGGYACGTRVNLEVDIIARYMERLSAASATV